jgi:triacylglycerol lipase
VPIVTELPIQPIPTRNPILLVHGLTDTSHKMRKIASHLRGLGWKVYDIDLKPNSGDAKLEVLAQQVADLVERIFPPHQPIDLLGFSMGGLVSRYYIQRLGGIDRVQRFISVSAPHNGTVAAYFTTRAGCVQMRPNHQFIADLNRDVDRLQHLNITSIWTPFDLMILPARSSQLGFGTDISLPVLSHVQMVFDRRILNAIAEALIQPVRRGVRGQGSGVRGQG